MRLFTVRDGVASDQGFQVLRLHRYALQYHERGRTLTVPIEEHLDHSMEVYWSQVRAWDKPYEAERLDVTRLQAILFRIENALIFEGYSPHFTGASVYAPEGAWTLSGQLDTVLS